MDTLYMELSKLFSTLSQIAQFGLITDGQKLDAAIEAVYAVPPQYRLTGGGIRTEDRGENGVSIMKLHFE